MSFIEVTSVVTGKRVTVNLADINRVIEEDDGCWIATFETKKTLWGFSVKESYEKVREKIVNARRIG